MPPLAHERYCDEIVLLTETLRAAISGADLEANVPTCPDWTLRELAVHLGGAQRWAGEIVRTRATEELGEEQVPDFTPDGDDPTVLDAWLAEGAAGTAEVLRQAGPAVSAWSWYERDRSAGFWARRMALETVVHLADAALTAKVPYTMAPELAADTIDEWLDIVAGAQAEGDPEALELRGGGRSIHLHATDVPDAEWLIEFGEDGFTWRHAHGKATVALRGPLTDLMLVFNRRLAPDSDRVEVLGDAELLDFWLARSSFG